MPAERDGIGSGLATADPASRVELPIVLEPGVLEGRFGDPRLLVVDLCRPEVYAAGHVPGAVHLDYADIVAAQPPVGGLLPDDERLGGVLAGLGIDRDTHVIAYDDEGGGRAARLVWTLHVTGHRRASMLDGGMHAWVNERYPLEADPVTPRPTRAHFAAGEDARADLEYIRMRLGDRDVALLDTRTPEEYAGTNVRAARGGHLPGAVNMDWVLAMDRGRNLRLRPEAELRSLLEGLGVTPDKEVIVYCQTHHRSSHTYVVLKSLDYPRVRGYPGAWSEWGNRTDTPIE